MRTEPRPDAGEHEALVEYLDYQRGAVLAKTEGLDAAQMARRHPPSDLTLGGLLYHLALVEESWMEDRFLGRELREPWAGVDWVSDPDWEFRTAAEQDPEDLRRRYRQACERSRRVVDQADSLDQQSVGAMRDGPKFNLRWVLLHLIEETARHAGHADLLRESIDGSTGD